MGNSVFGKTTSEVPSTRPDLSRFIRLCCTLLFSLLLATICTMAVAAAFVCGQEKSAQSRPDSQTENKALIAPVYEVASIKPSKPGSEEFSGMGSFDFSRLNASNTPLYKFIQIAFGLSTESQIAGVPNWTRSEKYDIEAKTDSALAVEIQKISTRDERRLVRRRMILALLEDRCQLKYHRETKEVPVYWLVVAKPGKIHESKGDCSVLNHLPSGSTEPGKLRTPACGTFSNFGNHEIGRSVSMPMIADNLSVMAKRTVIDKTGLTGKYDIDVDLTAEFSQLEVHPGDVPDGQRSPAQLPQKDAVMDSIVAVTEQQLGLKLESKKGPGEVIVIDHVERPSEN